ncbi:MAG: transglutaminaseTgpA domain-containing protein [Candidatus Limnocylindria bacterium]
MSRPREGWLSVGLLLIMVLAIAWSVEAAGWLAHLQFLVVVAIFSVAAGTAAALSALPAVGAISAGAVAGGLIVMWTIGGEYFATLDPLGRLLALREELIGWIGVVAVGGYPNELTPYALGLGMLLWTTGFMAAFAAFRHHRALDAVLISAGAVVANMSATYTDLFVFLLLFVLAALLFLLRCALADRQLSWQSRRLTQTDEVPTTIMRTGVTFVLLSVATAWLLTTVAVAAPLTGAWESLDGVWSGVSDSFGHVFGTVQSPNSRLVGTNFGAQMNVTGSWESRDGVVLRIVSERPYYLRTTTYDVYTGRGWRQSSTAPRDVASGQPIFPETSLERPSTPRARDLVTVDVRVEDPLGSSIFVPGFPVAAGIPVRVQDLGGSALFGGLETVEPISPGDEYQVQAYVSSATQADLAAARVDYPAAISALYLDTANVSEATRQLARQIVDDAGALDPYHQAEALARYLRTSPLLAYDTRAGIPAEAGRDLVDFFLFDDEGRRGYCQYFASAMVVMARSLGLPARMAAGFAPGDATDDPGVSVVRQRHAHAWAEVYFPGYGWEIFESTKTIDAQFTRAPGVLGGSAGGGGEIDAIDPRFGDIGDRRDAPSIPPLAGITDGDDSPAADRARTGNAIVVGILLLVAAASAIALVQRSRRRWALLPVGDRTWRQLERATGRAGIGARPAETVYEYAAWLGRQIPARRPEISTVADGKVWTDYSGRITPPGRQALIERAWRRLRLPLLVLVVRRRTAELFGRRDGRT